MENVPIAQLRLKIDMGHPGRILQNPFHEFETNFLVRHLASAELELDTNLETVSEKVLAMGELDRVQSRADVDAEF